MEKVIAVDVASNEEISLFDKTIHGWDGFVSGFFYFLLALMVFMSKDLLKFRF